MKKVEMIIPGRAVNEVRTALMARFGTEVSLSGEVCGPGAMRGRSYRGCAYAAQAPDKALLGLVLPDEAVEGVAALVDRAVAAVAPGPWKLFILPVEVMDRPDCRAACLDPLPQPMVLAGQPEHQTRH